MTEIETDFTNKVSDKALRAKCEKLTCENERDKKALTIVLGQKDGLSQLQRVWLNSLLGRKGKRFSHNPALEKNVQKRV